MTDSNLLSAIREPTTFWLICRRVQYFSMAVKSAEVWELLQEENISLEHYWFVVGSLMGNYYFQ